MGSLATGPSRSRTGREDRLSGDEPYVVRKNRGTLWSIHLPNTWKRNRKEGKYTQWHENQVAHVWNTIFTKLMLVMVKLRSAMFGVPNMQFSQLTQLSFIILANGILGIQFNTMSRMIQFGHTKTRPWGCDSTSDYHVLAACVWLPACDSIC